MSPHPRRRAPGLALVISLAFASPVFAGGTARAPTPKPKPKSKSKADKRAKGKPGGAHKPGDKAAPRIPPTTPHSPKGHPPKAHKRLVPKPRVRGDAKRGKKAFLDLKCQLCHSVVAKGIGVKGGPGTPPDLSTIGSRASASSLRSWLRQQSNHRGRKHPYPFNGTPQQLADLIAWLLTLRP